MSYPVSIREKTDHLRRRDRPVYVIISLFSPLVPHRMLSHAELRKGDHVPL